MADATHIGNLVYTLVYEPEDSRRAARESLLRLGETAVPALVSLLQHEDMDMRTEACRVLRDLGPAAASALPNLQRACNDESHHVGSAALEALAQIAPEHPSVIQTLEQFVCTSTSRLQGHAIHLCGRLGLSTDAALLGIRRALRNGGVGTRCNAARVIAELKDDSEEAQQALQQALNDRSDRVREYALVSLAQLGEKSVSSLEALVQCLAQENPTSIKFRAAYAIGKIGPHPNKGSASLALSSRLHQDVMDSDPDQPHYDAALARALGEMQDVTTKPLLELYLRASFFGPVESFAVSVALLRLRYNLDPLLPWLGRYWTLASDCFPSRGWLHDTCYLEDMSTIATMLMEVLKASQTTTHSDEFLSYWRDDLEKPIQKALHQLRDWKGHGTHELANQVRLQMEEFHHTLFVGDVEALYEDLEDRLFDEED
ncbi:MAG: HEAT repeat domain-containing protein [Deltaproteobacteria bacterium]|nr:MAG: HEAT repeat domain-containing protein [Deltaproteobacteria bacterium]